MVEQRIPSSQPSSNRIGRGSRRASFISLGLSHPSVSRSGGLTAKPFFTLGKQRWIPQRKQVQRSRSHQNQKTYLFSLETNILLYVPAYLHSWHRYFREIFCNFSALGNWMQVSCTAGKCSITPNYISAYVPVSISENDVFAFPTGY